MTKFYKIEGDKRTLEYETKEDIDGTLIKEYLDKNYKSMRVDDLK